MENHKHLTRLAHAMLALALAWPLVASADPEADYREGSQAYRERSDIVGAMPPLRRAADAGHVEAQLLLGFILDWSEENVEAVRYYRMAADAGDPRGQLELARMYLTGEGVEKDPAEARGWIEKSHAQGHSPATIQVGYAHLNGAMGYPKDFAKARELFQTAMAQGDDEARSGLAAVERAEAAEQAAAERETPTASGKATTTGQ